MIADEVIAYNEAAHELELYLERMASWARWHVYQARELGGCYYRLGRLELIGQVSLPNGQRVGIEYAIPWPRDKAMSNDHHMLLILLRLLSQITNHGQR